MSIQSGEPLVAKVERRLKSAAHALGTADPVRAVARPVHAHLPVPDGDPRYRDNALMPMAAPFEPSFSESQPGRAALHDRAAAAGRRSASTGATNRPARCAA